MAGVIRGRVLMAANAEGPALVTLEPLSFWGGLDPRSGEIIDRRHELAGSNVAGKVFAFPNGRGSSTASGILLESIRIGTAPAAIVLSSADPIITLGAIVARELYGKTIPLVVISEIDLASLRPATHLSVTENGDVRWN